MNHVDVKYHFVWDVLEDGDIKVKKIHTKDIPADMFTKVVPGSLQKLALNPSGCLSSVELIWMNYIWLDPLGRGYVHRQP